MGHPAILVLLTLMASLPSHDRAKAIASAIAALAWLAYRELPGAGAHALDHGVNRRAETPAQAWSLVPRPVQRVGQLGAGRHGQAG
jgi:hypothetical protein